MAIDTKPNLSSEKFEQYSGETLNLSGTTNIYGIMKITDTGSFCMAQNAGLGRTLISDAGGKGTWQNITAITGATEGLTKYDDHNVCLGGTITNNVDIYANNDFTITGPSSWLILGNSGNKFAYLCASGSSLHLAEDCAALISSSGSLNFNETGITLSSSSGGIQYLSCYHDTYVPRSLVDKEYVDKAISGSTPTNIITGATEGLTKYDDHNVCLGGTITNGVDIYANNDFAITGPASWLVLGNSSNKFAYLCASGSSLYLAEDCARLTSSIGTLNFNTESGVTLSSSDSQGIKYIGDYSSTFVDESLVTKRYVDNAISGSTPTVGITGATNGLTLVGKNVVLGGALTGDTYIYNDDGIFYLGDTATNRFAQFTTSSIQFYQKDGSQYGTLMSIVPNYINLDACDEVNYRVSCFFVSPFNISLLTAMYNSHICTKLDLNLECIVVSSKQGIISQPYSGFTGIVYADDYSANFNDRSLVDKEYVDNVISGGTASVTWGNITGTITNQTDLNNCLNARVIITNFNTFTGTTLPATYATQAEMAIYTGTTVPATYVTKTAINTLTGTTLPATYTTIANFNTFTGTTAPATYALKSLAVSGATNLGTGNGTIYTTTSANKLNLKTLSGGTNITITCNDNYIAINSTASGTVTGATNGLSVSGKNIELGGVLYKDTLICYSGKSFEIKTNSGYCGPYMCMDAYTPQAEIGAYHIGGDGCYGTLFAQYNNTQLGVVDNTNKSATLTSSLTTGRPYNELGSACGSIKTSFIQYPENIHILTNTGMTISGASSFAGIRYCGDYSANFVDRSLVDKGWVLNQGFITGGTSGDGITGATNGLSVSGKNIGLGGTLTGNTVISGGTSPYDFKLCGLNSFLVDALGVGIDNYVSVGGGNVNLYGGLSTISLTSCCWCAANYYPESTTCTVIKMDRSSGIYLLSTVNDIVINATCTADYPTSANVCIIGRDCVILTGGTGIYLCGLQAKSSETCVVYIDSNGSLSTGTVGAGATALSGLTDVTITSASEGDVLVYRSNEWVNEPTADIGDIFVYKTGDTLTGVIKYNTNLTISGDYDIPYKKWIEDNVTSSSLSTYLISGDSSATGFTVNHALNKQFVMVQIVQAASPYATVYTDVLRPNANCVCITFSTAPTTGTNYRILISG